MGQVEENVTIAQLECLNLKKSRQDRIVLPELSKGTGNTLQHLLHPRVCKFTWIVLADPLKMCILGRALA